MRFADRPEFQTLSLTPKQDDSARGQRFDEAGGERLLWHAEIETLGTRHEDRWRTTVTRRKSSDDCEQLTPGSGGRWGRMSAHTDGLSSCRCMTGTACWPKNVSDAPAGPLNRTIIMRWLALYAPLQWRAGILTRPEIDQQIAGTCPSDFASDVTEVRMLLDAIADNGLRGSWPDHPVFGRMSSGQWLRWA